MVVARGMAMAAKLALTDRAMTLDTDAMKAHQAHRRYFLYFCFFSPREEPHPSSFIFNHSRSIEVSEVNDDSWAVIKGAQERLFRPLWPPDSGGEATNHEP